MELQNKYKVYTEVSKTIEEMETALQAERKRADTETCLTDQKKKAVQIQPELDNIQREAVDEKQQFEEDMSTLLAQHEDTISILTKTVSQLHEDLENQRSKSSQERYKLLPSIETIKEVLQRDKSTRQMCLDELNQELVALENEIATAHQKKKKRLSCFFRTGKSK